MSSEFQRFRVLPKMQTDRPDDDFAIVAELNIRLRRNGSMSVEGFTGDKSFALAMLDNARDAIGRQPGLSSLAIPESDVAIPEWRPGA